MDGVFTVCRATSECMRLDQHEGACNIPVKVTRRTPSSRLRYLAKLMENGSITGFTASVALRDLARELE